jgi:hypothetical protein
MGFFSESFDSYNGHLVANGGMGTRWLGTVSSGLMVTGRFGGQACSVFSPINTTIDTGLSTLVGQFNIAINYQSGSGAAASNGYIGFRNGVTAIFGIRCLDGVIYIHAGSTTAVLLGAISPVSPDTWHTLSGWFVISATVGEIHMRVDSDDTKRVDLTGLNLGSAVFNTLALVSGNLSGRPIVDDIYINDSATAAFLPELRSQTLAVSSDGSTLNLTPSTGVSHFAVVDESPVSTTDYLSGTNIGDYDLLGVTNLSIVPGSIEALKLVGYAAKTDAAARAWNLGLESSGTTSLGSNLSLATTIQYYERGFATDPDTAAAWDQTGVNAVQLQPYVAA